MPAGLINEPLQQELERLSEDDYRAFVQTALRFRFVDPLALLIPTRGDLFLDLYLADGSVDNLIALVKALLASGEAACLSRLIPYVPRLSEREVRTLAKRVDKHFDVPEAFQLAVHEAIETLPPTIDEKVKGFFRPPRQTDRESILSHRSPSQNKEARNQNLGRYVPPSSPRQESRTLMQNKPNRNTAPNRPIIDLGVGLALLIMVIAAIAIGLGFWPHQYP